mmetsp:Transcript_25800/g.33823  ORF Transcript_25800/g.33823 Transcript_25800/m.33823 type:complete len:600 (+) Transcript_25800:58-1857(+)
MHVMDRRHISNTVIIIGSSMALSYLWNRFSGCLFSTKTYTVDEDENEKENKTTSSNKQVQWNQVKQPSNLFDDWSESDSEMSDYDDFFPEKEGNDSDADADKNGRKSVELRRMSTILTYSAQRTLAKLERAIRKNSNGRVEVGMREVHSLNQALLRLKHRADKSLEYEKALTEAIHSAPELFDSKFKEFMIDEFASVTKRRSRRSSNTELMNDMMLRRKNSRKIRRNRSLMDAKLDPRLGVTDKDSQELEKLMHTSSNWSFDIFKLQQLTELGALVILGEAIFEELALLDELGCDKRKFRTYLVEVQTMYRKVPYHSALHAADVCQAVFYFLSHGGLSTDLEVDHTFAVLLAALVHDVGHPGRNNKFLVETQNSLALTYNDRSPLENMHAATAFRLLSKPENNFIAHLEPIRMKSIRLNMIEMILATDNDHHSSLMAEVDEYLHHPEKDMSLISNARLLKLQVALHAADLSNPAKSWEIYMLWTGRVIEEFYLQGDNERELGIPISFAFDRENPVPKPKFQQGFINYIVKPLYRSFNNWDGIQIDECIMQLNENLEKWQAMDVAQSASSPRKKDAKKDAQKDKPNNSLRVESVRSVNEI